MVKTGLKLCCGWIALAMITKSACVGQPVHTPAAALPDQGQARVSTRFEFRRYVNDPTPARRELHECQVITDLEYGLTDGLAVGLQLPVAMREEGSWATGRQRDDTGLDDMTLLTRWRLWPEREDLGEAIDLAFLVGVDLPVGSDPFGSGSLDPILGVAHAWAQHRHSLHTSARWKFTTGQRDAFVRAGESTADLLNLDLAYMLRLGPNPLDAAAAPPHANGLYVMAEINGLYETNGDLEVFLSPGIVLQVESWAIEASIQLPIEQGLNHRPEVTFIGSIGVRLRF